MLQDVFVRGKYNDIAKLKEAPPPCLNLQKKVKAVNKSIEW